MYTDVLTEVRKEVAMRERDLRLRYWHHLQKLGNRDPIGEVLSEPVAPFAPDFLAEEAGRLRRALGLKDSEEGPTELRDLWALEAWLKRETVTGFVDLEAYALTGKPIPSEVWSEVKEGERAFARLLRKLLRQRVWERVPD